MAERGVERSLATGAATMTPMKVLTARVVDGKLDLPDGSLQEGAIVTLLVPETEEGFRLTAEEQALLLESIGQAERGEVVDGWQLLDEIQD
jgi:hypothetical protein